MIGVSPTIFRSEVFPDTGGFGLDIEDGNSGNAASENFGGGGCLRDWEPTMATELPLLDSDVEAVGVLTATDGPRVDEEELLFDVQGVLRCP